MPLLNVQVQRDVKLMDDGNDSKCRVLQNQMQEIKFELVAAEERAHAVRIQTNINEMSLEKEIRALNK